MRKKDPLYPAIEPFDARNLPVDGTHSLYLEQCGNRRGVAVVFLHGGPGSGCEEEQRRLFDPEIFRAVLFDQRGCGRSAPKGCLERNTTGHLVADLERIREELEIERWMLVGGSWGAALAVAYAEAHPERVSALVLRAVFLGSAEEWQWAFAGAAPVVYPEVWRQFVGLLPEAERGDPIGAYARRLMDPDPAVHEPAAWVWHDYERILSLMKPASLALPESLEVAGVRKGVPSSPFFEWHYMRHGFFLEADQLLRDAGRLKAIPGVIVQGRYDLLCPPKTAEALAVAWGNCDLRLIEGAGHSMSEPGVTKALVETIGEFGRSLA